MSVRVDCLLPAAARLWVMAEDDIRVERLAHAEFERERAGRARWLFAVKPWVKVVADILAAL